MSIMYPSLSCQKWFCKGIFIAGKSGKRCIRHSTSIGGANPLLQLDSTQFDLPVASKQHQVRRN